jgi:predicted neuraminidase
MIVVGLALLSAVPVFAEDGEKKTVDLALEAPVINTTPGPEYADDTRAFQGIPGIERAPSGRLWATWYGGGPTEGPFNYVILVTSGDDGKTWSKPVLTIDPPEDVRAFDPCLWHDPEGNLWLFWAQGFSHWDGRAGVWAITAEDSGKEDTAWSEPRRLCNGIMMNKPTVLSTGEWLLPAAIWVFPPTVEVKNHARPIPEESGSNVYATTDKGESWSFLGGSDVEGRACDEHMIVERKDGSLWMLIRTKMGIGESISTDRGKTWSKGRTDAIEHIPTARFFVRRLQSGKMLLVKHHPPEGKHRSHLTAYLSDDEGKTWQGELLVDERDGVSYPDGVQAPDGTIYLIYDYSRKGDKQIFIATFTEEDVMEGEFASDRARTRVLVNQATGG